MNDRRFDTLAGSFETNSRRGALRVIGALGVTGLVDRLGGTAADARKKKRGNRKKCPACICPQPTICPPRDTCPERKCCQCTDPTDEGILVGCHLVPASATHSDCSALCAPNNADVVQVGGENTLVCKDSNTCFGVSCPI